MKRLTSRNNPLVARFRAVAHGREPDVILLDGPHLVGEAIDASVAIQQVIVATDAADRPEVAALLDALGRRDIPIAAASATVMAAASPVRSESAIVALADRPGDAAERVYGPATSSAPIVVACDIQDPGNLGAIVRVSEAAGALALIAAGRSADPFGWKALRGSMGSALRLPIAVAPDISDVLQRLRLRGGRIAAAVPRQGTPLFDADLGGRLTLLIGGEGSGLPDAITEAADLRLTIPMAASVESLNAATTAAIVLYEARRQRTNSGSVRL